MQREKISSWSHYTMVYFASTQLILRAIFGSLKKVKKVKKWLERAKRVKKDMKGVRKVQKYHETVIQ